jgi:hypothetical protein
MTENIFRATMPVAICNVIFSKDHPMKIPCKNVSFQRYIHLSDVFIVNKLLNEFN